jgi:hypothetical protein
MKVYNKGTRTFNPGSPIAVKPGVWTEIPDEEAAKLIKMFPRELTSVDSSVEEKNELTALRQENSTLKAKIAEYEEKLAVLGEPTPPPAPTPKKATQAKPAVKVAVVDIADERLKI